MPKRSGSSADTDPSDEALAAELAMVKEAAAQAKAALVEAQRCSLEAEERVREVELRGEVVLLTAQLHRRRPVLPERLGHHSLPRACASCTSTWDFFRPSFTVKSI